MFKSKVKESYIIGKPISFEKGLNLNNESGPAGPINIENDRDREVTWKQGFPSILHTPQTKWEQDTKDTRSPKGDLSRDRGGANTGTLPSDPNGPIDKISFKNKDTRITEENIKAMTYVTRLASVLAKTALTFQDVLKIVKSFFPEIKMQFPKPPTYIWNPKKEPAPSKDKNKAVETEEEDDDKAKLDPQAIKDKLKIKLPQLSWTLRMSDGIEVAELGFEDGSTADFEIGAKANHLTITYTESLETEEEADNEDEEVADEDWRA